MPLATRAPIAVGPLLALLALTAGARAEHGLRDQAGSFGTAARDEANRLMDEFKRRTGKDLLIETFARLPEPEANQIAKTHPASARRQRFQEIAERRAQEAGIDGIYVLLSKQPAGHAVAVWPPENDALFPREDREDLDDRFGDIRRLGRNHDADLLTAVQMTISAVESNRRAQAAGPIQDGFHWTDAVLAVAALCGLGLVLHLLRLSRPGFTRRAVEVRTSPDVCAAPSPAAAGYWLYQAIVLSRSGWKPPVEEAPPQPLEPAPVTPLPSPAEGEESTMPS